MRLSNTIRPPKLRLIDFDVNIGIFSFNVSLSDESFIFEKNSD